MLFVVAVVIFRSCAPFCFCGLSILFLSLSRSLSLSLLVLSFNERHLYENATSRQFDFNNIRFCGMTRRVQPLRMLQTGRIFAPFELFRLAKT